MSQGKFTVSKYQATEVTAVMPIRVQPETLVFAGGVANTPPAGAVTLGLYAFASGGKRKYGVHARQVVVEWVGTAPAGYDPVGKIRLPVLTPAAYAAYLPGTIGTYLGAGVRVVSRRPETAR